MSDNQPDQFDLGNGLVLYEGHPVVGFSIGGSRIVGTLMGVYRASSGHLIAEIWTGHRVRHVYASTVQSRN